MQSATVHYFACAQAYLHTCTGAACLMRMWGLHNHVHTLHQSGDSNAALPPAMADGGLRVTSSIVAQGSETRG